MHRLNFAKNIQVGACGGNPACVRSQAGHGEAVSLKRSMMKQVHAQRGLAIRPFFEESVGGILEILGKPLRDQKKRVGGNASIVVGNQRLDDGLVDVHRVHQLAHDLAASQIDHSGGAVERLVDEIQLVLIV